MSLAFDEFGKPYLIVREQTKKKRTKGIEAVKVRNTQQKKVGKIDFSRLI